MSNTTLKNNDENFLAAEWPVLEMEEGGKGGNGRGRGWHKNKKYMGEKAGQVISSSQSSFLSPKESVSHLPYSCDLYPIPHPLSFDKR